MTALAECTHLEAARLARDARSVVLFPLGAVEEHGPHLPLAVDWLGAEEIARRIAPHLERAGYRPVLAPSLPYGVSTLALDWSGTVSLSAATLRRLVVGVVRGPAGPGFRRVGVTNYQADPDHLSAMAAAVRRLEHGARVQVLVAGFASHAPAENPMVNRRVRALLRSPEPSLEWHSGEMETAVMLAGAPHLVRRDVARRLPPARGDFAAALPPGGRRLPPVNPRGPGPLRAPPPAPPR